MMTVEQEPWELTDQEIVKALKPYWKDSTFCKECSHIVEGFYLLSPSERDRVVVQAQVEKLEKYLGGDDVD